MYTLFISDLHLSPNDENQTKRFASFIRSLPDTVDEIYIMGDLFNVWIGDDIPKDTPYQKTASAVTNALMTLGTKDINAYFIKGNRDFLVGDLFLSNANMTLLDDPCVISLYGKDTLLSHGDLLCQNDKGYQTYRKFVNNAFLQKISLALPVSFRAFIAKSIRSYSHSKNKSTILSHDVDTTYTCKLLEKHNTTQIIHGHTHNPGFHLTKLDSSTKSRYVLSDWTDEGHVLIYTSEHVAYSVFFDSPDFNEMLKGTPL